MDILLNTISTEGSRFHNYELHRKATQHHIDTESDSRIGGKTLKFDCVILFIPGVSAADQ